MKRNSNHKYIPKLNNKVRIRPKKRSYKSLSGDKMLVCSRCKTVFPEYLARCPGCHSKEWQGISEINPYNYLPMEQFLKICGHALWLFATLGAIFLLWQTNTSDDAMNEVYVLSAILLAFLGILTSVAYFGLSEITRRIERIQRRLRVFHENYRNRLRMAQTKKND